MEYDLDLSCLIPEARPIVARAATVYLAHTCPWFIGLIAHGSALKGGFIPGCSDIDLQLYLEDPAFAASGQLPLALAAKIHGELALIPTAPFAYIQCLALPAHPQADLVGPVPGAYGVIAGRLPAPEATAEQLRNAATQALGALDPGLSFVAQGLLEHGGHRLEFMLRLLCTRVWPVLYHLLTLQEADPLRVWALTKEQAIEALPDELGPRPCARRFRQSVAAYYGTAPNVEQGLALIGWAEALLDAAHAYARTRLLTRR